MSISAEREADDAFRVFTDTNRRDVERPQVCSQLVSQGFGSPDDMQIERIHTSIDHRSGGKRR